MTTNRLAKSADYDPDRPQPPKGDDPATKMARMRFWIERGNARLDDAGLRHLQWAAKDGHYWIEERE